MPDSIVRTKIKEALIAAGNNRHDAHKLLLTWAVRDPALLLSMTKPHLKAIATGLIDHHLRNAHESGDEDFGPDGNLRTAIDDIVASANKLPTKDKRKNTGLPPPKSTERQASTMRKLAAAFTRKKK
jgi:hypothetical protein